MNLGGIEIRYKKAPESSNANPMVSAFLILEYCDN